MKAQPLTPEAFAPYGQVLRRDPKGEPFQPLHTEETSRGWRVAILHIDGGPLNRLHRHLDTEECFCPLSGQPRIAVATAEDPDHWEEFILTEPICIQRGVWHEVVADISSSVFIAENASLESEARPIDPRSAVGRTKTSLQS